MSIFHNSRQNVYKSPYGATKTDTEVRISLSVADEDRGEDIFINYAYGLRGFNLGRQYLSPDPDQENIMSVILKMPHEPCLFFYWFEIYGKEQTVYCVKRNKIGDGSSKIVNREPSEKTYPDEAFQITVYDSKFITPEWSHSAVMYQIFPDRFARASDFDFEQMKMIGDPNERIYHRDWDEEVDHFGKEDSGYLALDFFGGSLTGIYENLGYIKSLGINVIYLNPIFKSRSNHRYDTGDYEKIDPMLGDEEIFRNLAKKCSELEIRLILDGVFSHTGADSRYFNKYGRYPEIGAYQDEAGMGRSEWYSWYSFNRHHDNISYDSWWGFPDLPDVNENDLGFRKFILGEDGVIRKWMKNGCNGWRLDVSDELPDDFIRKVRNVIKDQDPESLLIGEVWEDASNKVSYGSCRDFLLGNTHDSVMGYPFRNAVIGLLRGSTNIHSFIDQMETIRENYPLPAYLSNMNLISSHDIERAVTALTVEDTPEKRMDQAKRSLSGQEREKGERLLRLAMLIQFTFPGIPSIYYGDEIAMEGFRDPFNRAPMKIYGVTDNKPDILQWTKAVIALRKSDPAFSTGNIEFMREEKTALVYRRYIEDRIYYVALNISDAYTEIKVADISYSIAPFSGVVIHNGSRIFET